MKFNFKDKKRQYNLLMQWNFTGPCQKLFSKFQYVHSLIKYNYNVFFLIL